MLQFNDQPNRTYIFGPNYPSNLRKKHPFSRQPINKPIRRNGLKINWAKIYAGLGTLLHEYCSNSTIHGMNHIGSKRSPVERSWWLMVCVLFMLCCGLLIQKTYQKWNDHPVIVSFNERPMPVWEIPFPAITICPEAKMQSKEFNFTDTMYRYAHSDVILDKKREDQLMAVLQICDEFFHVFEEYYTLYSNETLDFVTLLKNTSITRKSVIMACRRDNERCEEYFSDTITDDGICFTYNGFSSQDMFKNNTVHNNFLYLSERRRRTNWSMENGYNDNFNVSSYPQRGTGTGSRLELYLTTFIEDIEAYCTEEQGFRLTFHSPDEYPMVTKKYIMLSLSRDINIAVRPQILTTSQTLESYDSNRRQCLFDDERQLKFFRVYNQNNCELECLTNYTLEVCDCVKFSMPHSEGTRVCSTRELNCVLDAEVDFIQSTAQHHLEGSESMISACNCMPACNSILYQTQVTQSSYDFGQTLNLRLKPFGISISNLTKVNRMSKLKIHFVESQFLTSQRSELYGMTDFVANCGGILGLCLGISLFSLVELLYYCLFRPMLLVRKTILRSTRKFIIVKKIFEDPY